MLLFLFSDGDLPSFSDTHRATGNAHTDTQNDTPRDTSAREKKVIILPKEEKSVLNV